MCRVPGVLAQGPGLELQNPGAFVRVTVAVRKHMTSSILERKGLIWLKYPKSQCSEGGQGRNSNQGWGNWGDVTQDAWRHELMHKQWRSVAY